MPKKYADKPMRVITLESEDGMQRYDFFTRPVMIKGKGYLYYEHEPVIRTYTINPPYCGTRFTYRDRVVTVEEGNQAFQALLDNGLKKVKKS